MKNATAAPVPQDLRVIMSTGTTNSLPVSWNQPSGPVTGYRLSRSGQLITINTTSLNINYVDTGLTPGQTYVYKVASYDAAGISPWSLKASGITKTGGSYTKPHSPFTDNSNMCQACHSIHMAPTRYKALYKRYSNQPADYGTSLSSTGQNLPGVDLCFNCHDGSGASYNVKQYYDQPTSAEVPWPGHMTRRTGTTALESSFGGWKYISGLPAGSRLACMVCHDSHVSHAEGKTQAVTGMPGNWKMLADGLLKYAKSPSGAWNSTAAVQVLRDVTNSNIVDTANNEWEKCTVCHHDGSRTNGIMRVAGLDLYWPSTDNGTLDPQETDVRNHGTVTNCSCHAANSTAQNNVHALGKGARPTTEQDDCSSCHPDVVSRTMSSGMTSRHFIAAATGNLNTSNPDRCASKCHVNHGPVRDAQKDPISTVTGSYNLYTDAPSKAGAANYDFTASVSQPGLCLSCHKNVQASNRPGGTSNSTAYVSAIVTQDFINSGHSYPSSSYKTGEGKRSYVMTCLKCHRDNDQSTTYSRWGPHASANRSLLYLPATQLGGNAGDEERTCLSCHSPSKDQWASRQMPTVTWRISQAFSQQPNWGHARDLLSPAIDRHRASEGYTAAWQQGWMPSTARHVECYDCHNPHYISQAYNYNAALPYTGSVNELETPNKGTVSKVLKGVWGVYPTTNWNSIPTASNYYAQTWNSPNPNGILFYTASATKQAYICLKCHSSYAYGTRATDRPLIPSGVPSGTNSGPENPIGAGRQSDILADFNPNNIGYHPIFSAGLNQPTMGQNPNWRGANGRLSTAYDPTTVGTAGPGLTTSFVPPWGASSLVTCSDCHSHSSSSYSRGYYTSQAATVNAWDFPRGPHGSSRRWMLRNLDSSIRYQRNNGTWYDYSSNIGATDGGRLPRYFCLNCHRADVYWNGISYAVATGIARVNHIPAIGDDDNHGYGSVNTWGIACMTCHGGETIGTIHGTGGAAPAGGANRLGRRLIYGAAWTGYTLNASSISCWTKGAADAVNNCDKGHSAENRAATRNYVY